MPSLTQTALLITNDSELSEILAENLAVFETSSPSYILMSSIEKCLDFCENSKDKFKEYCCNLKTVREKLKNLKYLKIYDKSDTDFDYDIGKIVISTANANISGTKLAEILRNNYQIETEMAYSDYVIAMTSVCDTEKAFDMLSDALVSIDSELSKGADTERVPLKISTQAKISTPASCTNSTKKLFRFKIRNSELLPSISGHILPEFPSSYPVKL